MECNKLLEKLIVDRRLNKDEWLHLITHRNQIDKGYLFDVARKNAHKYYKNEIYMRGLIEVSNYCKKDCFYCGIRCSNKSVERYRLELDDILECCNIGAMLGLKTFVLQGGEDVYYSDAVLTTIIKEIKKHHPSCAITLSLGERSSESYKKLYEAGANRYLLRHETANHEHYQMLHPKTNTLKQRMECLHALKEIGFQVGCGFMVGSPNQTDQTISEDFWFLQEFQPHMVGIGPFIPHHATPFKDNQAGSVEDTLLFLALTRILLPTVLLPATTALKTMHKDGFKLGILAGANVIMPNLTPNIQKANYTLYDNKNGTSVHEIKEIQESIKDTDYMVVYSRGDHFNKRGMDNETI